MAWKLCAHASAESVSMSDLPINTGDGPAVPRIFFTVEIRGGSPELFQSIARMLELAFETAVEVAKVNLRGKRNAPEVISHPSVRMEA